jgi:hypothetical protein
MGITLFLSLEVIFTKNASACSRVQRVESAAHTMRLTGHYVRDIANPSLNDHSLSVLARERKATGAWAVVAAHRVIEHARINRPNNRFASAANTLIQDQSSGVLIADNTPYASDAGERGGVGHTPEEQTNRTYCKSDSMLQRLFHNFLLLGYVGSFCCS